MAKESLWEPRFEIGVPWLDDQHRYIVDLTQRALAYQQRNSSREARRLLMELLRHVAVHFEAEENFMAAVQHPLLEDHRSAHQAEAEKLEQLVELHLTEEDLLGQLAPMLMDWVREHVGQHDAEIASFVKKHPEQLVEFLRSPGSERPQARPPAERRGKTAAPQ